MKHAFAVPSGRLCGKGQGAAGANVCSLMKGRGLVISAGTCGRPQSVRVLGVRGEHLAC